MATRENLILGHLNLPADETAAAIVADGRRVLSSVVASQVDIHRKYGGVVPELASREHLRQIVPVVREATERAGITLAEIDAIAVTHGPGLIGALLVGMTYGKVLALALGKPLIGVNHLGRPRPRGAASGARRGPGADISGGLPDCFRRAHDALPRESQGSREGAHDFSYEKIGGTRDDAAGEAYDKVARMLALGYPGGPVIDQLAAHGNPQAVRFQEPKMSGNAYDFSFSGIKTAVLYHLRRNQHMQPEIDARNESLAKGERGVETLKKLCTPETLDLVASFQRSVVNNLLSRTIAAAETRGAPTILVSGGVAANSELRSAFEAEGKRRNIDVYFPSRALSTDNAAMIAAAGYAKFMSGALADSSLEAEANLPLA